MNRRIVALAFLVITLSSCTTTIGPRTIPRARADYNEAIVRSLDEQLLLNLVRLRYRDNPMFLEIGSVTAAYLWSGGTNASSGVDSDGKTIGASAGVDLRISEAPTITYVPLQGEEFVRRLLSPVSPAALVALSQSGWSVERLFLCCVQQINGVRNAVAAAGPTPDYVPEFREFHRAARLLRELQLVGLWSVEVLEEPLDAGVSAEEREKRAQNPHLRLRFGAAKTEDAQKKLDEIRTLLKLDPQVSTFVTTPLLRPAKANEISITGRPLLGVLFLLSQAVEVPTEHEDAKKVTVTHHSSGERFDWKELMGPLFRVQTSTETPTEAAVKIRYRGHWFFIGDDDLNSKSTFNLLTYLFLLQSGESVSKEPLLTLGIR